MEEDLLADVSPRRRQSIVSSNVSFGHTLGCLLRKLNLDLVECLGHGRWLLLDRDAWLDRFLYDRNFALFGVFSHDEGLH
jgi:hypothetical protein